MGTKWNKIILSGKLYVICEVEANTMVSRVEMANCLVLAPSSLCKIMSNKNKIIKGKLNVVQIWKKKKEWIYDQELMKKCKNILMELFQQKRSENVPISGPILCQKATEIALRFMRSTGDSSNRTFSGNPSPRTDLQVGTQQSRYHGNQSPLILHYWVTLRIGRPFALFRNTALMSRR
jgi:hypothetical protein